MNRTFGKKWGYSRFILETLILWVIEKSFDHSVLCDRKISCIRFIHANLFHLQEVALNPVRILKNEAYEEKAEIARMSSFVGAIAIGDLVKSTLGPKGMDKILYSSGRNAGQVEVTNDGATILKSVGVENPAAKILVDMSRVQDDEVGDGTTSVTVLAAELLREAEKLIEKKLHPQTIIAGYRMAVDVARDALTKFAQDNSKNEAAFKEDLMNIARTTLSSKILCQHKE